MIEELKQKASELIDRRKSLLVSRAYEIAAEAHKSQVRKGTEAFPYITHLIRVASTVDAIPNARDDMVAAAFLHDIVEDTEWTIEEIGLEFGHEVGRMVRGLTDTLTPADGNRAIRKLMARERLSALPWDVQTIKLSDVMDNSVDMAKSNPSYARVYLPEQMELAVALKAGDSGLRLKTIEAIELGLDQLDQLKFMREGPRAGGFFSP